LAFYLVSHFSLLVVVPIFIPVLLFCPATLLPSNFALRIRFLIGLRAMFLVHPYSSFGCHLARIRIPFSISFRGTLFFFFSFSLLVVADLPLVFPLLNDLFMLVFLGAHHVLGSLVLRRLLCMIRWLPHCFFIPTDLHPRVVCVLPR